MIHIDQWVITLRSFIEPSGSTTTVEFIDSNNTSMKTYYVVVEKMMKEDHQTFYLYRHKFPTYQEALRKMKEDSKFCQIDYWDGDEWWVDVEENMDLHI